MWQKIHKKEREYKEGSGQRKERGEAIRESFQPPKRRNMYNRY